MKYSLFKTLSKIYFSLLLIFLAISPNVISSSHGATLRWNANAEEDLAGYIVYLRTISGEYDSAVNVGNVTEYELSDLYLHEGIYYDILLTAYDTSFNESDFSNEVNFFADDGIPIYYDNCPDIYNPDQEDTYPPGGNGIGDTCECEGDFDCNGNVDADDVILFLADFGRSLFNNPCTGINDCNGDTSCDGDVDSDDVLKLLEDFGRSQYNNPCPACDPETPYCTY